MGKRQPVIIIVDGPGGFHVDTEPFQSQRYEYFVDKHELASAYARGLSIGSGWAIEDRSQQGPAGNSIVVEQLNRAQWHINFPDERRSGVTNWVDAVAYALLCGTLGGNPIESLDIDSNRLTLAHAAPRLEVRR